MRVEGDGGWFGNVARSTSNGKHPQADGVPQGNENTDLML